MHGWPVDNTNTSASALSLEDVALLHQHSAVDVRTSVSFPSAPVLGAVFDMTQGAQASNMMSVVTDCPQR